jgi:hypothetical protein
MKIGYRTAGFAGSNYAAIRHRPINHDQNQAGSSTATSPKAAMSAPMMRMTIIAVPGIIHALLVDQPP